MEVSLVKIGNSQGMIIPKRILKKLGAVKRFSILEKDGSLLFTPVEEHKPRENWEKLFDAAFEYGYVPEHDMFENIHNEFDSSEWTW